MLVNFRDAAEHTTIFLINREAKDAKRKPLYPAKVGDFDHGFDVFQVTDAIRR